MSTFQSSQFKAIVIILILSWLISCKKEQPEPEPQPAPVTQAPPPPVGDYIKGDVDNQPFYYSYSRAEDTIANMYLTYFGSGEITFYRTDKNTTKSVWVDMHIYKPLDSLSLPAAYPNPSWDLRFYWDDYSNPHPDRKRYMMRDSTFKFNFTSKTDDVLTGTFSGNLTNNGNEVKTFTNGEFRIKVFRKVVK